MSTGLAVTAMAILLVMALALVRALLGPTIYDRVLAANMIGTKTVLLISVIDFLSGRGGFLDISLVYALINFTAVIAMLKFFQRGDLPTRENTQEGSRQ